MYNADVPIINARDFKGNLIGREIMVDAARQSEWFERVTEGSGLSIQEIFRVKSIEYGWINFTSDRRKAGEHHQGRFCGCGEIFRFNVVEP